MRMFLVMLIVLLSLASPALSAFTEFWPAEVATGQVMTPDENLGGPWIGDDNPITFGTGKDVTIKYDETTDDRLEITGPLAVVGKFTLQVNATTTAATTFTATTLKNVIPVNASGGTVPITLPDAALVTGVPILVTTTADPGSYYVALRATGGDKIGGAGGAAWLNTTSAAAGILLVSDGATYGVAGAYGTWA